jgi:MFS family permease
VDYAPQKYSLGAILSPLAHSDFRRFWVGLAVSLFGDGIFLVAISWQALEINNSTTSISIALGAWAAPQLFVFLVGGVLADRYDRRKLLIVGDVIRLVVLIVLTLLSVFGGMQLWLLAALAVIYGVGDSLFGPTVGAFIPQIVPSKLLLHANALQRLARCVFFLLIGPAVGGIIIGLGGFHFAFAVDALTFIISLVSLCAIKASVDRRQGQEKMTIRQGLLDIREGLDYVRSQRWLSSSLIVALIAVFGYLGPFEVVVPYMLRKDLGINAAEYGAIMAAGGVGAIVVSIAVSAIGFPKRFMLCLFLAWSVGCLSVAVLALTTQYWHAMIVLVISQGAFAAGGIIWGTIMQRNIPDRLLGRVSSCDFLISTALVPLSLVVVAPISQMIGEKATLIGGGLIAGAVPLIAILVPGIRAIEGRRVKTRKQQQPLAAHEIVKP